MYVELSYHPPLQWERLLGFLGARAAPSVEVAGPDGYARTVSAGGAVGVIRVTRPESVGDGTCAPVLRLEVSESIAPASREIVARVRQLLDLDANTAAIESTLADAGLAPIDRLRRGLRVPGAFDPFELAVRAILGQQVSVKGASTLMARLTAKFGERITTDHPGLDHLPATAERIAAAGIADIRAIGLPVARATTIQLLAREVAEGRVVLAPEVDVPGTMDRLMSIPGIGPWTAGYIAMRALHWPDAFPASDLVLRRNAGASTPAELLRNAERWRPWRAYAAMQLWSGINDAS
jgi:AraC family transcriptional regulator of adaptative response / DNA-3-methyladenine glycosylase II